MDGRLLTLKLHANSWDTSPQVTTCRSDLYYPFLSVLHSLSDVSFSLSGHTKKISAPIFMDNVACLGSEDKLIDCTYHTDTSEDDHSADVRVHCKPSTNPMQGSTSTISVVALTLALIVSLIAAVVGSIFLMIRYRKRRKCISSTER